MRDRREGGRGEVSEGRRERREEEVGLGKDGRMWDKEGRKRREGRGVTEMSVKMK